jgi:hypothetical protein
MVSTLAVAAGMLFCGGTICAVAAGAMHEDNRMASAVRRIAGKLLRRMELAKV